jgi:hypothetical protein
MPTLQNSEDLAGANQIFGGSHNTAPNQTGLTPNDSDLVNYNQLILAHLTRSATWLFPPIFGWNNATVSGGTVGSYGPRAYAGINTSSTIGSSAILYSLLAGVTPGTGSTGNNIADFSKTIWATARFNSNGGTYAAPNTVFRFSLGKTSAVTGAPTSKAIGFKVVFDTADVGHLFGEVYGTSLQTSGSSLASLTMASSNDIFHQVTINSQAGTVYFYADGALVGSLTGGPTSATAIAGTFFEYDIVNSGDATSVGPNPIDIYQPSFFVEN